MELDGENGFSINLNTIKTILLKLYENKPTFPIESIDILTEALGGIDQEYFINEKLGKLSANVLAEKSFKNVDNISEPNQVVDALLGDSFINIITKAKLLEKLKSLQFPVESKDQFTSHIKDLIIYGIPIGKLAEKLDYPIDKPEQILNRIKLLDHGLYNANVDLIYDIIEGEMGSIEDKPEPSAKEVQELPLKERIKRIIEMGKNAYREKNYEMAIQIYEEGLELDSDNTEIRFLQKTIVAKIEDMKKKEGGAFPVKEVESKLESKLKTELEPESEPEPELASDLEPVTKEEPEPESEQEPEPESEPEQEPESEPTTPEEITEQDEPILESDGDEKYIESVKTEIEPEAKAKTEVEIEAKSEIIDSEPVAEETILGDSDEKLSDFSEEKAKIGKTAGELGAAANNIEQLEKKLEEKFKALRDLAQPFKELPEDACKSCEGTGECYWCKGSGKCEKCTGTGKTDTGEDCKKCNGSGTCQSCESSGKCHWCSGSGKKK